MLTRGTSRASYVNALEWEEEELGEQEGPGSGWCLHLYRGGGCTTGGERVEEVMGTAAAPSRPPRGCCAGPAEPCLRSSRGCRGLANTSHQLLRAAETRASSLSLWDSCFHKVHKYVGVFFFPNSCDSRLLQGSRGWVFKNTSSTSGVRGTQDKFPVLSSALWSLSNPSGAVKSNHTVLKSS